jgi:hypothetical protein
MAAKVDMRIGPVVFCALAFGAMAGAQAALRSVLVRGRTNAERRQLLLSPRGVPLAVGREYLALIGPNGTAGDELVLPIVAGRVASPNNTELNGRPVDEALNILETWSRERPR